MDVVGDFVTHFSDSFFSARCGGAGGGGGGPQCPSASTFTRRRGKIRQIVVTRGETLNCEPNANDTLTSAPSNALKYRVIKKTSVHLMITAQKTRKCI
jgi:hypothetical protein